MIKEVVYFSTNSNAKNIYPKSICQLTFNFFQKKFYQPHLPTSVAYGFSPNIELYAGESGHNEETSR